MNFRKLFEDVTVFFFFGGGEVLWTPWTPLCFTTGLNISVIVHLQLSPQFFPKRNKLSLRREPRGWGTSFAALSVWNEWWLRCFSYVNLRFQSVAKRKKTCRIFAFPNGISVVSQYYSLILSALKNFNFILSSSFFFLLFFLIRLGTFTPYLSFVVLQLGFVIASRMFASTERENKK